MKSKILYILIICLTCFISGVNAYSDQRPNYPVKLIDGAEYYVYTVEAGEGLYSISRRFGVSQSEINNVNPQIHDGLQAGQVILIPKKDEKGTSLTPSVPADTEFVLHTVERRQTLFSISRKYNVTQDAIIRLNPKIKEHGLQTGDTLRIPVNKKTSTPAKSTTGDVSISPVSQERTLHIGPRENHITHNVSKSETLYSISRRYKVSVNDLKRLNPETSNGLKAGMVLKIPFADKDNTELQAAAAPTVSKPSEPKTSYKIAYLLPFMLNDKNDPTAEKFMEFYMGSLLAINNNKGGNVNFEVYAYDTGKSESKVFEVINKPEMLKMDLIIGPAYTTQIAILSDFVKRRRINTVIPFSSKAAYIEDNTYLFQFNPSSHIQSEYVTSLFRNNFKNANVTLVETNNTNQLAEEDMDFNNLKQQLERQQIKYNVVKSAQVSDAWKGNLDPGRKNIVIFDTNSYSAVQNHLSNLYDVSQLFDVVVLGQYAWRNQSGKRPKMYYVSPFTGSKLGTQFYEDEFRKYYGNKLPIINPRYDLLGYDITTFFISTMKRGGFTFNENTKTLNFNTGVQSDFKFKRTANNGGFVNQQLYLIEDEAQSK